jgi:hypothetical protein
MSGLLEKSKLAQHAYEKGWDNAGILEIESNSRYRKYKELVHIACLINAISRPSLDISPIRIPLISNEVSSSLKFQSRVFRFYSTDGATGRHYISSHFFFSFLCIGAHAIGFLG